MSTSAVVLAQTEKPVAGAVAPRRAFDFSMMAGIAISIASVVAGIAATGVHLSYFLQPTGVLIVLGGTFGVTMVTTPRRALLCSARTVLKLFTRPRIDRAELVEEILSLARPMRSKGILAIEPRIAGIRSRFLKESLTLAIDVPDRAQLKTALETRLRLRERHGETDAKTLEVAGGFAPTIGVLGTVVGLIEVLRQFSNLSGVAGGVGAAFVSTIYGLGLANLILLPAANRIRADAAETFEIEEMIVEGVVSLLEGIHPALLRDRLNAYAGQAQ